MGDEDALPRERTRRVGLAVAFCFACGGQLVPAPPDAGDAAADVSLTIDAACGSAAYTPVTVGLNTPLGIALDSTYAYVTDRGASTTAPSRVLRFPKTGGDFAILAPDEPSAWSIAVRNDALYWTLGGTPQNEFADGSLRRLLLGVDVGSPVTFEGPAALPTAVALDDGAVYWAEMGVGPGFNGGSVRAMPIDGGSPATLADGGLTWSPGYLALEDGFIYWTAESHDHPGGFVARIPLAGGPMETIATTGDIPTSIAVDSSAVYWVEWGAQHDTATIRTAGHSGENPRTLWSGKGMIPLALAVGACALYWTEAFDSDGLGDVKAMPLAGGNTTTLDPNAYNPFAIAVDDTFVYWTTSSPPNAPGTGSIKRVAK